jgi:hypothetical protein
MVQQVITGLVGLLALFQPAIAAPKKLISPYKPIPTKGHHNARRYNVSPDATCVADNKLYRAGHTYSIDGQNYLIHCGSESSGITFSTHSVSTGGFSSCFRICRQTEFCAAFDYVGGLESGDCLMKQDSDSMIPGSANSVTCEKDPYGPSGGEPEPMPGSKSTSASSSSTKAWSTSSIATAISQSTPAVSSFSSSEPAPTSSSGSSSAAPSSPSVVRECQQDVKKYGEIYHGDDGSEYQISCGEDHYGGDLNNAGSATFLGCVPICNANPDCIGFSYAPGICYLKRELNGKSASNDIDFALNLARNSTLKPAAGSCRSISSDKYNDENDEVYTIECGRDHNGGDIGAKEGKTFVDCMGICDKTEQCIAFAWTGSSGPGTCYLKGTITTGSDNSDVSYAYKGSATHLSASFSASASASEIESISTVLSTIVVSVPTPTMPSSVVSPVTLASDSSSSLEGVLTMTVIGPTDSALPVTSASVSSLSSEDVLTTTVVSYSGFASPSSVSWETTSKVHYWWQPWHQPLDPKSDPHHPESHQHAQPTGGIIISKHTLPGITYTKYATEFTNTKYVSGPAPTIPTLVPLPVDPTKVQSTKPDPPTPTFNEPMQQEHVGNEDFCNLIRGQPPQKLVCEVIDGAPQFDGMFVQDPDRSKSSSIP